jgi:hypothetical protein
MQKGRAPLPGLPFHPHQRVEFAECITDSAAVEAGYKLPVVEVDLEVVVRRRTAACSSLHLDLLRDLKRIIAAHYRRSNQAALYLGSRAKRERHPGAKGGRATAMASEKREIIGEWLSGASRQGYTVSKMIGP